MENIAIMLSTQLRFCRLTLPKPKVAYGKYPLLMTFWQISGLVQLWWMFVTRGHIFYVVPCPKIRFLNTKGKADCLV